MDRACDILIGITWCLLAIPLWLVAAAVVVILGSGAYHGEFTGALWFVLIVGLGLFIGLIPAVAAVVIGLFVLGRRHQERKRRYVINAVALPTLILLLFGAGAQYNVAGGEVQTHALTKAFGNAKAGSHPGGSPTLTLEIHEAALPRSLLVHPPVDKRGDKPQDVVIAFFKDVAADRRQQARAWWHDHPDPNRGNNPQGFDAFFNELRTAHRVVIEPTGKGKEEYYSVRIRLFRGGHPTQLNPYLTLERIGDQWKILRSLHW